MDSKLELEMKRVGNLKQNKEKSKEYIEKQALLNLKIREFKKLPLFEEKEEFQSIAETKFKSYLENYQIESNSDIDTLRSLVYNEVFEMRLQEEINKLFDSGKYPTDKLTKQLTEIQKQKLDLKVKLGIDKEDVKEDELTGLQILQKKYHQYIQENKNEFTTACGGCGKLLLLNKRVKDFDCIEHPWFIGRWYFNYEILKDVKDGKLTKEDASRYLKTSLDYIDFCLENWQDIVDNYKPKKGN